MKSPYRVNLEKIDTIRAFMFCAKLRDARLKAGESSGERFVTS